MPDVTVGPILTRRATESVTDIGTGELTNSVDQLIDESDIIFESTGDPLHASVVVEKALAAGRPVVTMNAELHVTTGSFFHGKGFMTEAEGDQPGATAFMHNEAVAMGFKPLAYVNIKGFLNPNPTREDMEYWSARQKLSLPEVVSFTDGTKLQIEQALTANALDADIAQEGLIGGKRTDIFDTDHLVQAARQMGRTISDYVVAPGAPPGVFVLADHEAHGRLPFYGPYQKLRTKNDSAYLLLRAYHLCALEVSKTLRRVIDGDREPLMTNGPVPRISTAAVAKRALDCDTVIEKSIGGFDVRGYCVRTEEHPGHVPLGLLKGARVLRPVEPEQVLTFDDVEPVDSRALEMWNDIVERAVVQRAAS